MKRRGFTIVELLIVITIMGALLILSVANLRGSQVSARDSERKTDIESVALALDNYYINGSDTSANVGKYPSTIISSNISSSHQVQALVIAGGGGGGGGTGGGGGAGGVIYNATYTVIPQAYSITVGTGGVAGIGRGTLATSGTNSIFDTLVATGGGYGAHDTADTVRAAANGGSGGGSANWGGNRGFGTGIAGQGFNGGSCPTYQSGGGGGGAGALGQNGQSGQGGNGGAGVSTYSNLLIGANAGIDINWIHWIAGGGAGALGTNGSAGGSGGGGSGGTTTVNGGSGITNTGSGGGGGALHAGGTGGSGGSGIVIIAYPTGSIVATGGTLSTYDGNTIHKFTGDGTFTISSFGNYTIKQKIRDIDIKSITAPNVSDPALTFISATNNIQLTTGPSTVLPLPTTSQYVYQPLQSDGSLCTSEAQECRKFNLYSRLEGDYGLGAGNTIYMVTGKNQ